MADTSPEFIIRLIVRARNEISAVMSKATKDVDGLTSAVDRNTTAEKERVAQSKKTAVAVEDLRKRHAAFTDEVERGNKSTEEAVFGLRQFKTEFDKLARAQPAGSKVAADLNAAARAAEDLAKKVQKSADDQIRVEKQLAKDRQKVLAQSITDAVKAADARVAAARRAAEEEERADQAQVAAKKARSAESSRLLAQSLQEVEQELSARDEASRKAGDFEDKEKARVEASRHAFQVARERQLDQQDANEIRAAEEQSKRVKKIRDDLDNDLKRRGSGGGGLLSIFGNKRDVADAEEFNQMIENFRKEADAGSISAVRFAGNLRATVYLGAIAFFQQLVGIGVSLGATLVSIAGSAIQAGAALGGVLAAGAAQAIPVIGLLAAAWGRVGAVFDAVKQAQKARLASQFDDATAADKQRQAADSIRSAQEALANAQRQATTAQENLTKARADAVRQIQDLVAAEKSAELQAESARLAQQDASKSLRRSIASGNLDELPGNALATRQSSLDLANANRGSARATFDARKAVGGGVEGMDAVVAARRAVADAARQLADAKHSLAEAGDQASETVKQIGTADRLLAQMIAQLSPAEKRLYLALEQTQKDYKKVFTGPGGILESITDAFTYGVQKADDLLHDKRLVGAARDLADAIGTTLHDAFDFLSGPTARNFFVEMAHQAEQNLPIVLNLAEHIFGIFESIAKAGSPAFHRFLEFFTNLLARADQSASSGGGIDKLTAFFDQGERYAESWIKLTIAVGNLFLALTGASAKEGQDSIDGLTKSINVMTDYINTHRADVQRFFAEARRATGDVMTVVIALSKALFGLFHEDQVNAFSTALTHTVIPSLVDVLKIMGAISKIFLDIAGSNVGSIFARLLITAGLLKAVMAPLLKIFGEFFIGLGKLAGSKVLAEVGFSALRIEAGPLAIVLSGIAATLLIITGRVHDLGSAIKILTPVLAGLAGVMIARNGLAGTLGKIFGRVPAAEVGEAENVAAAAASLGGGAKAATTVAEGAKTGALLRVGMMGALKKAGWIGLGISAGQGILEGLKDHSVTKGFRGFFSSVTFDLVDSVGEAANKSAKRLSDKVNSGNLQLGKTQSATDKALGNPASNTADQNDFNRLTDSQKQALKTLIQFRTEFDKLRKDRADAPFFDSFYSQLTEFAKTAPPQFKNTLEQMVEAAHDQKKKLDAIFEPREVANRITTSFGVELQSGKKNIKKVVEGLIDEIKPLPKQTKSLAVKSAIQMAEGLEEQGHLPKGSAEKIRDEIVTAYEQMRSRAHDKTLKTARQTSKTFSQLANVVGIEMQGLTATVNNVLKALGGKEVVFKDSFLSKSLQDAFGSDSNSGNAAGGFIGNKGERGGDTQVRLLGRGEAVLNYAHQKLVEPAMRAMYGFGLGGMFKHMRAQHGAAAPGGFAAGGFFPAPGTNYSVGDEPTIAKRLGELARSLHLRLTGLSGYRTPQHSVEVGGFANDPHTRGQASDTPGIEGVVERILNRFGLTRPFGGAAEADHIQLLHGTAGRLAGSVVAHAASVASSAILKLKAPRVTGSGPLSKIAQRLIDRAYSAANKRISSANLTAGGGTSIAGFGASSWNQELGKIAKSRHWSAPDWRFLVKNESGGDPKAVNPTSGAVGLGQMLGSNIAKYMGRGTSIQQIIGMANYIRDRYHNPTLAKAFWLAQSPHWYARGGEVPGPLGRAVPIVAHAKEWVVNQAQQSKIAGMAGMSVHGLRGALGFSGGPSHYAGGGVVGYQEPIIHGIDPGGELTQAALVRRIIASISTSVINKKRNDALTKSFDAITGEGGILDQLSDSIGRLSDKLAVNLKAATYTVDKASNVISHASDPKIAAKAVSNLQDIYTRLLTEQTTIQSQLDDVAKRLKSGSISAGERHELQGIQRGLGQRLDAVKSSIADNLESTFAAVEDQINAQVTAANTKASQGTGVLDIIQRIRTLIGGSVLSAVGASDNEAMAQQRGGILGTQVAGLQDALARAKKTGHTDTAKLIEAQIEDLQVTIAETLSAGISADVDEITRQAGRQGAALDIRSRFAQALGRVGDLAGITADRISSTQGEITKLIGKQQDAASHGFAALAEQIGDQITDLQTSVVEMTAQGLQDAIGNVDSTASRRSSQLDLQDRISAVQESMGNYATAYAGRASTLGARGQSISDQIGSYQTLLGQAESEGNIGATRDLLDKIGDLTVQLQENAQALRDNTASARQAMLDDLTGRSGFQTGVFGNLTGLISSIGALLGTTDTASQGGLIQRTIDTINKTLFSGLNGEPGLAQQLLAYGIDIRGQSPTGIASTLGGVNYSGIESGMDPAELSVFENLVNSVIDMTGQLVQNTTQLKTLNSPAAQSWSSTAWQWFRNAIFNGAGGLLPQYQNAALGIGQGFQSLNPTMATMNMAAFGTGSGEVFAPQITNIEQTQDMDADQLAYRLYWLYKTKPKGSG